jgi:hypothetical protein
MASWWRLPRALRVAGYVLAVWLALLAVLGVLMLISAT